MITVNGKVPTTGKVGQQIKLPMATAMDNVDDETKVYVFVEDPRGGLVETYGTAYADNVFTPSFAGEYLVKYLTFDGTFNIAYETYTITVE